MTHDAAPGQHPALLRAGLPAGKPVSGGGWRDAGVRCVGGAAGWGWRGRAGRGRRRRHCAPCRSASAAEARLLGPVDQRVATSQRWVAAVAGQGGATCSASGCSASQPQRDRHSATRKQPAVPRGPGAQLCLDVWNWARCLCVLSGVLLLLTVLARFSLLLSSPLFSSLLRLSSCPLALLPSPLLFFSRLSRFPPCTHLPANRPPRS